MPRPRFPRQLAMRRRNLLIWMKSFQKWMKARPRKKKVNSDDEDSDDSVQALKDLEVWDRYEEGLEEVLPAEVLGWLL